MLKNKEPTERVAFIVPCRNEADFIKNCLDSIIASSYPKELLELVVVDGMSDDGTPEIVAAYASRYDWIRLLNNPQRVMPAGLNIGIHATRGQIVCFTGAHSRIDERYIELCVEYLANSGADLVGGRVITMPREIGRVGSAIVAVLSHPFGVGMSYFRIHPRESRRVDTLFGGALRREVFDEVGMFNERLVRGQDLEFNLRLKQAGKSLLLAPEIIAYYYARTQPLAFCRHSWLNGEWAILPFLYSPIMPVAWRHLVPMAFVVTLLTIGIVGLEWHPALWLLAAVAGTYMLANATASVLLARRQRDARVLLLAPLIFASLHLCYGLGSLVGVGKLIWRMLRGARRPTSVEWRGA